MATSIRTDVAIIGGGPAGSTLGSLIRKYRPALKVHIFEREKFPRDHVGESLLPTACRVLDEMGCWDVVERANFPIKIGAIYRWGQDKTLWDFDFLPVGEFKDEPRPGRFEGYRQGTAFQVDRCVFDQILLNNAKERGCVVRDGTRVAEIVRQGDAVQGLVLEDGTSVSAKHYVDASGASGILRRAMGVNVNPMTTLQNVAFWDYWENTEWAVSVGNGGTRILVLSLPYGWLWFIPVSATRTSLGLVCPAEYFKSCGSSPEELYRRAIHEEPTICALIANASQEGKVRGAKDWSFLVERLTGENWYLAGECAGFADPILSAGVTLAMTGARELAYTIIALDRGKQDSAWLKANYESNQSKRISQHIKFADFWYLANGQFSDLKAFTQRIAADAGLTLDANEAFRWLGTGGFANEFSDTPGVATFSVGAVKGLLQRMTKTPADWALNGVSVVRLSTDDAVSKDQAYYSDGRITPIRTLSKGSRTWPLHGVYERVFETLNTETIIQKISESVRKKCAGASPEQADIEVNNAFQFIEVLLQEGWLIGEKDPRFPPFRAETPEESDVFHTDTDVI